MWLAVGASYRWSDDIVLHVGYTHIWVDSAHMHITDETGHRLEGSMNSEVDIIAIGANMNF